MSLFMWTSLPINQQILQDSPQQPKGQDRTESGCSMEKPPGHHPSKSGYDWHCHNTSFLEKVTLNPSCQGQDLGQKTLGSYHQKTHGASNTQAWIFGPALSPTNCMSLGKLLNITEPRGFFFFSHIHSSVINSFNIYSVPHVCQALEYENQENGLTGGGSRRSTFNNKNSDKHTAANRGICHKGKGLTGPDPKEVTFMLRVKE